MSDEQLEEAVLRALYSDVTEPQDWEVQQRNHERRLRKVRAVIPIVAAEMRERAAMEADNCCGYECQRDRKTGASIRALPLPCEARSPRTTGDKR